MFYISLIICIISSVIAVQPISDADNAKLHALPQNSHKENNNNQQMIFSESGVISANVTQNNKSLSSLPDESASGIQKAHSRRRPPPKIDSESEQKITDHNGNAKSGQSDSKSNMEPNSNKSSGTSNSNQTTSSLKVNKDAINLLLSGSNNLTNLNDTKSKSASDAKPTTIAKSTTTTTTTTTTSTTTTTTTPKPTTTTTPVPKKPLITFAVEDIPGLLSKVAESHPQLPNRLPLEDINGPHSLESSEMITFPNHRSNHNYLMAMIGIIVAIPLIIVGTNCAVHKVRDIWSKRRYRRMDYLIEDMYN